MKRGKTISPSEQGRRGRGRVRSTSRAELERIALDLFIARGFDTVTVDDIADAAGIGRRTFFRYFPSKNDVPWGDFERLLVSFADALDATPPEASIVEAVRSAVRGFNDIPAEEIPRHRERMRILLSAPDLVANSTVRYAAWRAVIADFVARRRLVDARSALPQAVSWACLGISLSAYEQWVAADDSDLLDLIDESFRGLRDVFSDLIATREQTA